MIVEQFFLYWDDTFTENTNSYSMSGSGKGTKPYSQTSMVLARLPWKPEATYCIAFSAVQEVNTISRDRENDPVHKKIEKKIEFIGREKYITLQCESHTN